MVSEATQLSKETLAILKNFSTLNSMRDVDSEVTLKKIEGMFAIAAWDRNSGKLFLSRDRMGEKPLYYSIDNDLISFGSNINSLKIIPNKNLDISQDSVKSYFKLNYIPRKKSIYKNIFKLTPGDYLEYNVKLKSHKIYSYWNIDKELKSFDPSDSRQKTFYTIYDFP